MSGSLPRWAERPVLLALGLVVIYATLIPFAPGSVRALPDLVYCLVIAWVVRRPRSASVWMVLLVGIGADLLLSRPMGLGALGLVLAAEAMRGRQDSFLVEWGLAVLTFGAMLAGIVVLLRLSFLAVPEISTLIWHLVATAIAYPVVVAGLVWGIGLHKRGATR